MAGSSSLRVEMRIALVVWLSRVLSPGGQAFPRRSSKEEWLGKSRDQSNATNRGQFAGGEEITARKYSNDGAGNFWCLTFFVKKTLNPTGEKKL
jgi:hypothetical protein